jgi:hypothetical protein
MEINGIYSKLRECQVDTPSKYFTPSPKPCFSHILLRIVCEAVFVDIDER